MDQVDSNLLSQLRDIHGAADPGWWPPAWGWWVLLLLGVLLVTLLTRHGYRQYLVSRRRKRFMAALAGISKDIDASGQAHEYLAHLNRLFRAVALRAFPGTHCARLQGNEWVQFIHSMMPEGTSCESLAALASGPYEAHPDFLVDELEKLARIWVAKYG